MFKKKLLVTALALSSPAFVYTSSANAHGYVKEPASRAYLCSQIPNWQDKINKCGAIAQEPQSVEAPKTDTDFPADGKIASGGNGLSLKLDNEAGGWPSVNIKAGPQQFKWRLTQPHSTTNFKYYITKDGWSNAANAPLTRSMFDSAPFCESHMGGAMPSADIAHNCNVPNRTGEAKIYAVWRINDTGASFYQLLDVNFGGEVVTKPVASISPSSYTLSTNNLSLDGSASTGKKLKYSWAVTNNADKVVLENAQSSKANIRLKAKPDSDFDVGVRLTVTNADNETDSKQVTLKAKAEVDATKPEADAGRDFTVVSNKESRGYDLNGLASKNAESYKWTIVSGQDIAALQVADGGNWVQTVNAAKARALIKPGKVGKVTYRLTVTAKNGKTHSDDITVTVKAAEQASDIQINTGGNVDTIIGQQAHSISVSAKNGESLQGATFKWSALNDADKIQFGSTDSFSTIIKGVFPYNNHADIAVQVVVTKDGKESKATKIIKVRP
ncbi:lytic polysaccharide monooxygenase [Enterobacteriaceae bacterium C23F]